MVDDATIPGPGKTVLEMSLRERVFTWLFSQGASTVLLFMLVAGAFYKVPDLLDKIQEGYERIDRSNQTQRQLDRAADEAMRERTDRAFEKISEAMDRLHARAP